MPCPVEGCPCKFTSAHFLIANNLRGVGICACGHASFEHTDAQQSLVTPLQTQDFALFEARLSVLEKEFNASEYDIWTESGRSDAEQGDFKQSLIRYYDRGSHWPFKNLRCMATNEWHPPNRIIASHIWMSKTRGRGLPKFGLTIADLNNPRNGLLLLGDIEKAFDKKQLCILYQPFAASTDGTFLIKVLDPEIKGKTITGSRKTFADIDMTRLRTPKTKIPYRRILSFHARCSYHHAKDLGWIQENELFNEYFDLSDTASAPDTYK